MGAVVSVFLVSHAIALREALAAQLDADPRFEIVGQADSAAQARVRVPAARPDLVVVTRVLPDVPGVELIAELHRSGLESQLVLFSVWVDDELLRSALAAGAVGVQTYAYVDQEAMADVLLRAAAGEAVLPADAMRRLMRGLPEPEPDPLAELTDNERRIFELVGDGMTNREIATALHLGEGTARNYVSRLMHKLGKSRRAQVVAMAAEQRTQSAAAVARDSRSG
ncbi:MAG TPA: response regulator transcription factor [Lapillicoccus sp.]|nr:response regulator transcription factor [Lapillicoccus sp.]